MRWTWIFGCECRRYLRLTIFKPRFQIISFTGIQKADREMVFQKFDDEWKKSLLFKFEESFSGGEIDILG